MYIRNKGVIATALRGIIADMDGTIDTNPEQQCKYYLALSNTTLIM